MNDITVFRDTSPIWDTMSRFEREIDEFFKDPFFSTFQTRRNVFPKINIKESKDKYSVDVSIPGFDKDDIKLEFKDGCLHLSSQKREEKLEEDETFIHREIGGRSFYRVIPFEKAVDEKKISAKHDKGILLIQLPKLEQKEEKSTTIKIE